MSRVPRPKDLAELPKGIQAMQSEGETACSFCGVSYLIHHEIRDLEAEISRLKHELATRGSASTSDQRMRELENLSAKRHDEVRQLKELLSRERARKDSSEEVSGLREAVRNAEERASVATQRADHLLHEKEEILAKTALLEGKFRDSQALAKKLLSGMKILSSLNFSAEKPSSHKIAKDMLTEFRLHELDSVGKLVVLLKEEVLVGRGRQNRQNDEIEQLRYEVEKTRQNETALQQHQKTHSQEILSLAQEKDRLLVDLGQRDDEISQLNTYVAELKQMVSQTESQFTLHRTESQANLYKSQVEIDDASKKIALLEAESRFHLGKLKSAHSELDRLSSMNLQLEEKVSVLQSTDGQIVIENKKLLEQIEEMDLRCQQLGSEVCDFKAKHKAKTVECEHLTQRVKELQAGREQLLQQIEELSRLRSNDRQAHQRATLAMEEKWRSKASEVKRTLEEQLAASNAKTAHAEAEKMELNTMNQALQQAKGKIEGELERVQSEYASFRAERMARSSEQDRLEKVLRIRDDEISTLKQQLSQLQDKIDEGHIDADQHVAAMSQSLDKIVAALQSKTAEVTSLKATVANQCRERAHLVGEIEKLRNM